MTPDPVPSSVQERLHAILLDFWHGLTSLESAEAEIERMVQEASAPLDFWHDLTPLESAEADIERMVQEASAP